MILIQHTLATLVPALLIFLAFCFGQASFDISQWSEHARGLCAIFMLGGAVFGVGASIAS